MIKHGKVIFFFIQLLVLTVFWGTLISCGVIKRPYTKRGFGLYHRIKKNENLWDICKTYKVSISEIVRINDIDDPNLIRPGEKIFIPNIRYEKRVPKGISLLKKKRVKTEQKKREQKCDFLWPVQGKVSSTFGLRDNIMHSGIDITAPTGGKIVASCEGTVIYSDNKIAGYGNLIVIKHQDNFFTIYAHNQKNLVNVGDIVKGGDLIGYVGSTGKTTGPHLHFEIRIGKKAHDPMDYLKK